VGRENRDPPSYGAYLVHLPVVWQEHHRSLIKMRLREMPLPIIGIVFECEGKFAETR
jgi:hypothetical protein